MNQMGRGKGALQRVRVFLPKLQGKTAFESSDRVNNLGGLFCIPDWPNVSRCYGFESNYLNHLTLNGLHNSARHSGACAARHQLIGYRTATAEVNKLLECKRSRLPKNLFFLGWPSQTIIGGWRRYTDRYHFMKNGNMLTA